MNLSPSDRLRLTVLSVIVATATWQTFQADAVRAAQPSATRPNLIIVLCDDLGYGDLACFGHPVIETPNVDRLAAEGMRLTSCYAAAANCSPARTGLMTGRTPYRVGIRNWIPMFSPMHVARQEITNTHPHGSPGPLREKKGHVYEGGIRVPGIIRWPGHTTPGSVCDEPISGVDVLPTFCSLGGAAVPSDRAIDCASFLSIFEDKPVERTTPLYWQYNYSRTAPKVAMRIGDWKILATLDQPDLTPGADITAERQQTIKRAKLATFELYNLRTDIGETTDLSQTQPERLKNMSAQLQKLYQEVVDESPVWPNWEWPRFEGARIRAAKEAGIWPAWKKPAKKSP